MTRKDLEKTFDVSPKEAIELQRKLRYKIKIFPLKKKVRLVAGADVSCNMFGRFAYAGIIVFTYPDFKPVEYSCARNRMEFPYIPGLLSFREIPALLKAWGNLQNKPDLVVVDGHGIAHPRRLGIASHFSLSADVATIGCAKNILYGETKLPALEKGSFEPIIDPKTSEILGVSLRTKDRVMPVFISPGNKVSVDQSLEIIMNSLRGYRLPEETRQAHHLVNEFRLWSKEIGDRDTMGKIF